MSQLSVLTTTKRVHLSIPSDYCTVKATARNLTRILPNKRLYQARRMTVSLGSVPEASKLPFSPSKCLVIVSKARSMKPTRTQLHNLLSIQSLQQLGSVLMSFSISMSCHSILFVAPSVQASLAGNNRSVSTTTSNIHNRQPHQSLHPSRRRVATLVTVAKFAIHTSSPRVQIPIGSYRSSVIRSARDMSDNLPRQRMNQARNVFPSIIPMSQPSVISSPPRVHLPFPRQYYRMTTPTSNHLHSHSSQCIDVGGLVLIACITYSKLAVLTSSPGEYSELVWVGGGSSCRGGKGGDAR
mmetsp:Transcript_12652/g.27711  ORF Transcript_12652/g.27711 Transcript_12652/m.27711 type:complete len:297 (+) Transcript_12652:989-1879(+)